MKENNKLIRIYSGNEVTVNLLKGRLENIGVSASIQNDSNDSFLRGVPTAVDLYIQQFDFKKAEQIINEFIQKNKV
jgi:alpha-amylase/alpha-mannosidase (GH57 family)